VAEHNLKRLNQFSVAAPQQSLQMKLTNPYRFNSMPFSTQVSNDFLAIWWSSKIFIYYTIWQFLYTL